jgi:hypothetical protein
VLGTPLSIQKKRMRLTDIQTTMRYGNSGEANMRQAREKIVRLALISA